MQDLYRQFSECNTQLQKIIKNIGNQFSSDPVSTSNMVARSENMIALTKLCDSIKDTTSMLLNIHTTERSNITNVLETLSKQVNDAKSIIGGEQSKETKNKKSPDPKKVSILKKSQDFDTEQNTKKDSKDSKDTKQKIKETKKVRIDNIESSEASENPTTGDAKTSEVKVESKWLQAVQKSTIPQNNQTSQNEVTKSVDTNTQHPSRRNVAPDVEILSYTIKEPKECHKYKGWWCWCPLKERFYLSINGFVFEGVTTEIYPVNKTPCKFYEHRDCESNGQSLDYQSTDYYVPRMYNSKSRDRRRFTARMTFVPASKEPAHNQTYLYRIGSRDTLNLDRQCISSSDFRLFGDLTGNFLLCWTATAQHIANRARISNDTDSPTKTETSNNP